MDSRNKKVLVTGSDGFIGSHLVEELLNNSCNVKAFVYYNSFNSWGLLDYLPKDKLDEIDIFAGDNCHISVGAIISGGVAIGSGVFIGVGAVVRESVVIGNNSIIGAGSVLKDNLRNGEKVAGNPARLI